MASYCPPLIPTHASIKAGLLSAIGNNPYTLPALPTLPSPVYPSIGSADVELDNFIGELQNSQFLLTTKLLTLPLTGFLGLNFNSIMPSIPGTPFNLATIINGNLEDNLNELRSLMENPNFLNSLSSIIPTPLFQNISSPDLEVMMLYQHISKEAVSLGIPTITSMISSVVGKLEIGGMGSVPTIPSMSVIKTQVESLFPDLSAEMPSVNFPQFSLQQKIKSYTFDTYTSAAIGPIYNFCMGPLSNNGLSFAVVPMCVDL